MSTKRDIGDTKYLNKRIPQNPKYQHVKSRLDTGCSLTRYMERLEEMNKNYRYKKDELFKRLKVTTFAQLVIQVASVSELNESVANGETPRSEADNSTIQSEAEVDPLSEWMEGSPQPTTVVPVQLNDNNNEPSFSPRSTLQSVISGVGELDLDKNGQMTEDPPLVPSPSVLEQPYPDCPYLLLDVRDRDQYDQCHIISAYSYPIATLSRTMNPYTKEVLDYKNAPGKLIILYDEDERIASQAATTMCERGFENLFMLSGGLKVLIQKFPEGMTTGSIPVSCLPSPTVGTARKRSSPRTVSLPAEKKWRFSGDDINNIHQQLEEILIPSDSNSRYSRMSASSAYSKSSARSRQSSSLAGSTSARSQSSRPWK